MKISKILKDYGQSSLESAKTTVKRTKEATKSFGSGLYGNKERGRVAGNYLETLAGNAVSIAISNPITLGIGFGLSYSVNKLMTQLGAKMIEENLERHPPEHKYSPNLQKMVNRLYDISGLSVEDNPVYDFKAKKSKDGKKSGLSEALDKMSLIPNAAASNINIPVIMISEALLELLDDDEEYAVLAHEFVHAAGEHQKVTMPKRFLASAAIATNGITRALEFITSGLIAVPASIAASLGVAYGAQNSERRKKSNEMCKELGLAFRDAVIRKDKPAAKQRWEVIGSIAKELNKKEKATTPEELLANKRERFGRKLASQAAGVGVVSAFNPAYLAIYAVTKSVNHALAASNKRLSRIFEFHADEAAVTKYEAKPLALVTALRKITAVVERSQRNANGFASSDVKVSKLGRAWAEMNATHPPVAQRAAALSEIARGMGYGEEEIDAAVNGEIDISNIPDMPLEMAEKAAMMLHATDNGLSL